jgi:hypothetical protein
MSEHLEASNKASNLLESVGSRIKINERDIYKISKMTNSLSGDELKRAQKESKEIYLINDALYIRQEELKAIAKNEDTVYQKIKLQQKIFDSLMKPLIGDSKEFTKLSEFGTDLLEGGANAYLAVLKASIERFLDLDKAAAAFRRTTGLITPQMEGLGKLARAMNVEMANLGVTLEKAYAAVTAMYGAFQTTALVSGDMVAMSAQLAANIGLAVEDIAKFESRFSEVAKTSGTTANNVVYATIALSKMAGVAPKEVMHDIANASENTLKFLSKNPMQLMRAAVEARRLGTSLESIANSARGMLDYQTSMTSELEASALLNKNISFQSSRQLAWEGKLQESRTEALRQISSAGDFTQMTVYQQEALARAAGMTVEEVIKQTNQQKALNAVRDYGTDAQRKELALYEEYNKKLQKGNQQTTEDLVKQGVELARHQNMQAKIEQITNALAAAWTDLVDAMLPIAQVIMPIVVVVAKALAIVFRLLGMALPALAPLGLLVSKLATVGGWIGEMAEFLSHFAVFGKAIPVIGWIITGIQFIFNLWKRFSDLFDSSEWAKGDWIDRIWMGIKAVGGALYDTLIKPFVDIWDWLSNRFFGHSPSKLGMSIVTGLFAVGGMLFDALVSPFTKAWDFLKKLPLVGKLFGMAQDAAASVSNQVQTSIETAVNSVVEIKNLDDLRDVISKLTDALNRLAGGGTAPVPVAGMAGNSNTALISKFDELIGLLKAGGIAVNLDGRKVSSAMAPAGT